MSASPTEPSSVKRTEHASPPKVGRHVPDSSVGDTSTMSNSSALIARSGNEAADMQGSMAEPELLALIIELRLSAASKSDGVSSKDKDRGNVAKSTANDTAVDTLDLCHRKIQNLPYEMVDIIKDDVVRLALGYNYITTLPPTFTDLSRLRYLNVRANLMSTFPAVLCTLPNLEILDISRNKIRKLPSEPGRLLELRVLSISNNRLKKLPTWLCKLKHLRILKLEGNPINWPPPHISVMPSLEKATASTADGDVTEKDDTKDKEPAALTKKRAEDRHMMVWISQLKSWLEESKDRRATTLTINGEQAVSGETKGIVVEGGSMPPVADGSLPAPAVTLQPGTPGESTTNIGATLMSIDGGTMSDEEAERGDEAVLALPVEVPKEAQERAAEIAEKSHRADETTSMATQRQEETDSQQPAAQDHQVSEIHPAPSMEAHIDEEGESAVHSPGIRSSLALQQIMNGAAPASPPSSRQHNRNQSLSSMVQSSAPVGLVSGLIRRGLKAKKSLPDLRSGEASSTAIDDTKDLPDAEQLPASASQRPKKATAGNARRPPLPQMNSDTAAFTRATSFPEEALVMDRAKRPTAINEAADMTHSSSAGAKSNAAAASGSNSKTTVDEESNNYFRRLSTLPASTISKAIPPSVLHCVDGTRGILYALSVMHTALKQFITLTSDERMTSQLRRALDIASMSITTLINALDRFDALSRIHAGSLQPSVLQAVLGCCSESVNTFRKLISVLSLQMKPLQSGADIRYSKTLLLLLYGSLAEIGTSWTVMQPLINDVQPYLNGSDRSGTISNATSSSGAPTPVLGGGNPLPSIAEASSPISADTSRFGAMTPTLASKPQRRRHAGSFSAQDVAQGAMIPTEPLPALRHHEIRARLLRDNIERDDTALIDDGVGKVDATLAFPQTPRERGKRGAEERSNTAMSRRTLSQTSGGDQSTSNGVVPHKSPNSSLALHQPSHLGSESSKVLVDDHLILLLVRITSIAYSVWDSINEHLTAIGVGEASTQPLPSQDLSSDPRPSPKTPLRAGNLKIMPISSSSSSMTVMADPSQSVGSPDHASSTDFGSDQHRLMKKVTQSEASFSANATSKLKEVRSLTQQLIQQTNQLETICEKIQERSGPRSPILNSSGHETFRQIATASGIFVKSIVHISQYLKSISSEHQLPRRIKANLAQLTTCARDLTLHLHFLGGPAAVDKGQQAQYSTSMVASPSQQRQLNAEVKPGLPPDQ